MALSEIVAPQDALQQLVQAAASLAFLDVRSEGEWVEGEIPGFHNDPILTNLERHEVGLCYKHQGQDAALALGHQLTAPFKAERVARWTAMANGKPVVVCCWRGGARSRLACDWLAEAAVDTLRVRGGYKSMRAVLREALQQPLPLLVLSGATGTGKTRLLRELAVAKVDLEACANHRGSAFGRLGEQPSQTSFENRVAMALLSRAAEYLVEDESRLIGVNELPLGLKNAMYAAPVVVLELPLAERAHLTWAEYVLEPIQQGLAPAELQVRLQAALDRIQRKLGALRHASLSRSLADAMREPQDPERHAAWIEPLLADYYDPRYLHAFDRQPRTVLFRGNRAGCYEFLSDRLAVVR